MPYSSYCQEKLVYLWRYKKVEFRNALARAGLALHSATSCCLIQGRLFC